MHWPWVSRGALEAMETRLQDARDQINWLRKRNEGLQDQIIRIQRRESGLPEVAREPRQPVGRMPDELREYIEGFANPAMRKQMRDQAIRRRVHQGESWASITKDVLEEENVGAE